MTPTIKFPHLRNDCKIFVRRYVNSQPSPCHEKKIFFWPLQKKRKESEIHFSIFSLIISYSNAPSTCYLMDVPCPWLTILILQVWIPPGTCIIKLITAIIYGFRDMLEFLSTNTRLGWKGLPGTNTLSYYGNCKLRS